MPWRRLSTEPVKVEIDNVLLVATANTDLLDAELPGLAARLAAAVKGKLQSVVNAEIVRKAKAVSTGEETMLERLGR